MSKTSAVICVGYPESGVTQVGALLTKIGVASALPSRREKLHPIEINARLRKLIGAPPVEEVRDPDDLVVTTIPQAWSHLGIDLVLANLHQPVWGWCDPFCAGLLDYWKELDPGTRFVLVYDEPFESFRGDRISEQSAGALSWRKVEARLASWIAYNEYLIRFLVANPERCVLVSAKAAIRSPKVFREALDTKFLLETAAQSDLNMSNPSGGKGRCEFEVRVPQSFDCGSLPSDLDLASTLIDDHFIHVLRTVYPDANNVLDELTSLAALPSPEIEAGRPAVMFDAWRQASTYLDELRRVRKQSESTLDQLHLVQERYGDLANECRDLKKAGEDLVLQVNSLTEEARIAQARRNAMRRDKNRRIAQLSKQLAEVERSLDEARSMPNLSRASGRDLARAAFFRATGRLKALIGRRQRTS